MKILILRQQVDSIKVYIKEKISISLFPKGEKNLEGKNLILFIYFSVQMSFVFSSTNSYVCWKHLVVLQQNEEC